MISIEGTDDVPPDQDPEQAETHPDAEDQQDAPDPIDRGLIVLLAAFIAIIVAVGAIGATLWSAAFSPEEPPPTTAEPAGETAQSVVETPLPGSVAASYPTLGEVARYEQNGDIVYFLATGNICGRGAGTLEAKGSITNASWLTRTYDYVIEVELIRVWNRSPIGLLETTVEGLSSGQSAEWSVDIVSSRVSTVDCEVVAVTVVPVGG